MSLSNTVNAARGQEDLRDLATISATIHPQRATNGAGNTTQERETSHAKLSRKPRHFHIRQASASTDPRCALRR